MKLYIYILLFVLLIIYINRHSICLENFTDDDFTQYHYDTPNQYDVLKTDKVSPIQIDTNSNQIPGFNSNDYSVYSNKQWTIKPKGFSDIYNYEDLGGEIIYDVANGLDVMIESNIPLNGTGESLSKQGPVNGDTKSVEKTTLNKITEETVPLNINYQDVKYNLLGTATNPYYNQYFYIFENLVKQKLPEPLLEEELTYMKNNRIFQYLLVKMHNGEPKIIHWVGPRNKINVGDVVYLSLGTFQLGPLSISKIY